MVADEVADGNSVLTPLVNLRPDNPPVPVPMGRYSAFCFISLSKIIDDESKGSREMP